MAIITSCITAPGTHHPLFVGRLAPPLNYIFVFRPSYVHTFVFSNRPKHIYVMKIWCLKNSKQLRNIFFIMFIQIVMPNAPRHPFTHGITVALTGSNKKQRASKKIYVTKFKAKKN